MSEAILENPHNYSWWDAKVGDLPLTPPLTVNSKQTVRDVARILQNNKLSQIPVVDDDRYEFQQPVKISYTKNLFSFNADQFEEL